MVMHQDEARFEKRTDFQRLGPLKTSIGQMGCSRFVKKFKMPDSRKKKNWLRSASGFSVASSDFQTMPIKTRKQEKDAITDKKPAL